MVPDESPCCDMEACKCLLILEARRCRLCGPCSLEEPSALGSCKRWCPRLLARAMRGAILCRRLSYAWLSTPPRHISDTWPLGWSAIVPHQLCETQLDVFLHCRWEARSFILDHTGFSESAGGHPDAAGNSQESRSVFAISQCNQHHLRISLSLLEPFPLQIC